MEEGHPQQVAFLFGTGKRLSHDAGMNSLLISILALLLWATPTHPTKPQDKQAATAAVPLSECTPENCPCTDDIKQSYCSLPSGINFTALAPARESSWTAVIMQEAKTVTITDPKNELKCYATAIGDDDGFTLTCIDKKKVK
jgi:hypothetical protein